MTIQPYHAGNLLHRCDELLTLDMQHRSWGRICRIYITYTFSFRVVEPNQLLAIPKVVDLLFLLQLHDSAGGYSIQTAYKPYHKTVPKVRCMADFHSLNLFQSKGTCAEELNIFIVRPIFAGLMRRTRQAQILWAAQWPRCETGLLAKRLFIVLRL